ncbi:hypothetical protein BH11ARM2_BH11ARM2_31520 [soil metagenome]
MRAIKLDADKLGQIAGTACAIHCAITGVALGVLSVVGLDFLGSETSEFFFIGITFCLGVWALVHGVRKHRSWVPAIVFISALTCIVGAHLVSHQSVPGVILSVVGGLGLVSFHILNQRYGKVCACGHCH